MSCALMGVEDVHKLLSAMQKNLECPICLDLMKEPVTTRCEHIFCRFCMLQLLTKKKKGHAQCPLCKKEVTKRSLQESPRFKLLIDGLMKIINAFELDSGYKFFSSQDYAKNILVTCMEKEKEEQTVVQTIGCRNRNRKRPMNRGECGDLPTLLKHFKQMELVGYDPEDVSAYNTRDDVQSGEICDPEWLHHTFPDLCALVNLQQLQLCNGIDLLTKFESPSFSNSRFYPIQSHSEAINRFQIVVEQQLIDLSKKSDLHRSHHNLTRKEQLALRSLEENPALVIRNADKGGSIVVLDRDTYISEAERQLSDTETYTQLRGDPTQTFIHELDLVFEEGMAVGMFSTNLVEKMKIEYPVIPIFHHLPKIHKPERPPRGRPIVAGIGGLHERLGQWLDSVLQPIVKMLPGYIKDTREVLKAIHQLRWPKDGMWISMDVSSLYSCIPHQKAIQATDFMLRKYTSLEEDKIQFLCLILDYLLRHNYFLFEDKFYLQKCGASMGAPFSPSLANIYMGWWELEFIFTEKNPFYDQIFWEISFLSMNLNTTQTRVFLHRPKEIDTNMLLPVGTRSSNRPKRNKPETDHSKSKRALITVFESDSSQDDLFKKARSLGNDNDASHSLSDQGEADDPGKRQNKDSRICEVNDHNTLKPETEDVVASDLAEYGFSERDIESTQSNLLCMDDVKALTENTTQKTTLEARDSLISDGDFAEREDEQSPLSNLVSNVIHSEHNNQAASTMQLAKLGPDESQALKIAIDYQYDKDDSLPEEMASSQSSPGDALCTVPRKRMKRSIQRVKEWLLKTPDFPNATSWDKDLVSEIVPEVYHDGSVKGSSTSDETEIMPAFLSSDVENIVEKPVVTVEDKVFGKVYKREKKSNPVFKITCVADVHVDSGIHPSKMNAVPNAPGLKRRRRAACGLQPEDFIRREDVTEENGGSNDDSTLCGNLSFLDGYTNGSAQNSKCLNTGENNPLENNVVSISHAHDQKNKKKHLRKKRCLGDQIAHPLLLVRGSVLSVDKQQSLHQSSEIKIDGYPSSNEPGKEDSHRNVRRSRRLSLLPDKTIHTSPAQITEAKDRLFEKVNNDSLLKTTLPTKQLHATVELVVNETKKTKNPIETPKLTEANAQPAKSVFSSINLTKDYIKENSNTQVDVVINSLSTEEVEDSDIDTEHLLTTFKSAKRMSFKLDAAEGPKKENCNPVHLADANTNFSNKNLTKSDDKENLSSADVSVRSAALNLISNVTGKVTEGQVQNLSVRLLESSAKLQLGSKKKHSFDSHKHVEGYGECAERPILYENDNLPDASQLNNLSLVNETNPHEQGNQGRNAAVSRHEELVLLSQTESLSLHPTVNHQSPSAVRRGDTESGTGQGGKKQALDYCYQKHCFDEEEINQSSSINEARFSVLEKPHFIPCRSSPGKSPEVLSDTPDGLLCIVDKSRADRSFCTEAEKSFVFENEKVENSCRSMSTISGSQVRSRKKRNVQKLESSEEESSEDEDLPCFNHILFGNTSSSAGQKNASASSSPKQQGGGVLTMFSSNSTSGKTQTSLNLPLGAFSSSQESVNLFSSQSNTSDHSANRNPQEHSSRLPKCSEKSPKQEANLLCKNGEDQISGNELSTKDYEDSLGGQNLGDVSEYESEASHAGDSSGLSSQFEILNTQQRDAMQNNLEKLQREMAALEAVLEQHGTRSPSSEGEQASTAENSAMRLQEAHQEQTVHDAVKFPAPGLNQTTASPRSMRIRPRNHGALKSVNFRKGRLSLQMESTEAEQQSRQTYRSIKKSSSPTFTSPTTGFGFSKIPVIPNRRNFSLVASGLSQSEMILVHKFARKTQSLLSSQMSESTTHVIMKTDEQLVCERTLKYFLGIAGRKWVVSYDWIVQSFREGRILDEYDFEVRGDVINGRNHKGPRRSRLGSDGLLLSDFEICCLGTFKDMTRENLEWMVSLCGASLVKEPQLFKHKEGITLLVVMQSDGKTDYAALKKKYRSLIVSREWVLDSVASYKLQTFDSYLL
ncbi:breast cancer type 1 susceptibility protein [Gastrophryne carolinensis]